MSKLRPFSSSTDLDIVADVWLETSINCQDFIPSQIWTSHLDDMKNVYLPGSNTTVACINDQIVGFISLVNNFIAAIFVLPSWQGKGIGKDLLNHAKKQYDSLKLNVYSKNVSSQQFYDSQGFVEQSKGVDILTNEQEIVMSWSR